MKSELFEAIYNFANNTYMPTKGRDMGVSTAKVNSQIKDPKGGSADEILNNVRDEASYLVDKLDVPNEKKPQIVTQVVYDKMTSPSESKFQAAILDKVLEDCCAADFAGFVPEKVLKKEDDESQTL